MKGASKRFAPGEVSITGDEPTSTHLPVKKRVSFGDARATSEDLKTKSDADETSDTAAASLPTSDAVHAELIVERNKDKKRLALVRKSMKHGIVKGQVFAHPKASALHIAINNSFYHFVFEGHVNEKVGNTTSKAMKFIRTIIDECLRFVSKDTFDESKEMMDTMFKISKKIVLLSDRSMATLTANSQTGVIETRKRLVQKLEKAMGKTGGSIAFPVRAVSDTPYGHLFWIFIRQHDPSLCEFVVVNTGEGSEMHASGDAYMVYLRKGLKENDKPIADIVSELFIPSKDDKTTFNGLSCSSTTGSYTRIERVLQRNSFMKIESIARRDKLSLLTFPSSKIQKKGGCTTWSSWYASLLFAFNTTIPNVFVPVINGSIHSQDELLEVSSAIAIDAFFQCATSGLRVPFAKQTLRLIVCGAHAGPRVALSYAGNKARRSVHSFVRREIIGRPDVIDSFLLARNQKVFSLRESDEQHEDAEATPSNTFTCSALSRISSLKRALAKDGQARLRSVASVVIAAMADSMCSSNMFTGRECSSGMLCATRFNAAAAALAKTAYEMRSVITEEDVQPLIDAIATFFSGVCHSLNTDADMHTESDVPVNMVAYAGVCTGFFCLLYVVSIALFKRLSSIAIADSISTQRKTSEVFTNMINAIIPEMHITSNVADGSGVLPLGEMCEWIVENSWTVIPLFETRLATLKQIKKDSTTFKFAKYKYITKLVTHSVDRYSGEWSRHGIGDRSNHTGIMNNGRGWNTVMDILNGSPTERVTNVSAIQTVAWLSYQCTMQSSRGMRICLSDGRHALAFGENTSVIGTRPRVGTNHAQVLCHLEAAKFSSRVSAENSIEQWKGVLTGFPAFGRQMPEYNSTAFGIQGNTVFAESNTGTTLYELIAQYAYAERTGCLSEIDIVTDVPNVVALLSAAYFANPPALIAAASSQTLSLTKKMHRHLTMMEKVSLDHIGSVARYLARPSAAGLGMTRNTALNFFEVVMHTESNIPWYAVTIALSYQNFCVTVNKSADDDIGDEATFSLLDSFSLRTGDERIIANISNLFTNTDKSREVPVITRLRDKMAVRAVFSGVSFVGVDELLDGGASVFLAARKDGTTSVVSGWCQYHGLCIGKCEPCYAGCVLLTAVLDVAQSGSAIIIARSSPSVSFSCRVRADGCILLTDPAVEGMENSVMKYSPMTIVKPLRPQITSGDMKRAISTVIEEGLWEIRWLRDTFKAKTLPISEWAYTRTNGDTCTIITGPGCRGAIVAWKESDGVHVAISPSDMDRVVVGSVVAPDIECHLPLGSLAGGVSIVGGYLQKILVKMCTQGVVNAKSLSMKDYDFTQNKENPYFIGSGEVVSVTDMIHKMSKPSSDTPIDEVLNTEDSDEDVDTDVEMEKDKKPSLTEAPHTTGGASVERKRKVHGPDTNQMTTESQDTVVEERGYDYVSALYARWFSGFRGRIVIKTPSGGYNVVFLVSFKALYGHAVEKQQGITTTREYSAMYDARPTLARVGGHGYAGSAGGVDSDIAEPDNSNPDALCLCVIDIHQSGLALVRKRDGEERNVSYLLAALYGETDALVSFCDGSVGPSSLDAAIFARDVNSRGGMIAATPMTPPAQDTQQDKPEDAFDQVSPLRLARKLGATPIASPKKAAPEVELYGKRVSSWFAAAASDTRPSSDQGKCSETLPSSLERPNYGAHFAKNYLGCCSMFVGTEKEDGKEVTDSSPEPDSVWGWISYTRYIIQTLEPKNSDAQRVLEASLGVSIRAEANAPTGASTPWPLCAAEAIACDPLSCCRWIYRGILLSAARTTLDRLLDLASGVGDTVSGVVLLYAFEQLSADVIDYDTPRTLSTVLAEAACGFIMKRQQLKLIETISGDAAVRKHGVVHQMGMGVGKTSFVTPQLIFTELIESKYTANNVMEANSKKFSHIQRESTAPVGSSLIHVGSGRWTTIRPPSELQAIGTNIGATRRSSVFVVVPQNLVTQTAHIIRSAMSLVGFVDVHKLAIRERGGSSPKADAIGLVSFLHPERFSTHFDQNRDVQPCGDVCVVGDKWMQRAFVNVLSGGALNANISTIKKSVKAQRKSQLSAAFTPSKYPWGYEAKIIDAISEIANNKVAAMEKFVDAMSKALVVCDEVDSVVNPLSCDTNMPWRIENSDTKSKHLLASGVANAVATRVLTGSWPPIDIGVTSNSDLEAKIELCSKIADDLVHNVNYGLGSETSQQANSMLAIPFSCANQPSNGSRFTDFELCAVLTARSYIKLVAGKSPSLRRADLIEIRTETVALGELDVEDVRKEVAMEFPTASPELVNIFVDVINGTLDIGIALKKSKKALSLMSFTNRVWFAAQLAANAITKYAVFNPEQLNVGMREFLAPSRCGWCVLFSGTVTVHTADKETRSAVRHAIRKNGILTEQQLRKSIDNDGCFAIIEVDEDKESNALTSAVLAGIKCPENSECTPIFIPKSAKIVRKQQRGVCPAELRIPHVLHIDSHKENHRLTEKALLRAFVDGKYDVLVDVAGVLRSYDSESYAIKLSRMLSKEKKSVMYVDRNGTRSVIGPLINDAIQRPRPETSMVKCAPCVVFYDQRSTIGIDFVQPMRLRGLIVVDEKTTNTAAAQGAFRLRRISRGHTIDFVFVSPPGSDRTALDDGQCRVSRFLSNEEDKFKLSTQEGFKSTINGAVRAAQPIPSILSYAKYEWTQSVTPSSIGMTREMIMKNAEKSLSANVAWITEKPRPSLLLKKPRPRKTVHDIFDAWVINKYSMVVESASILHTEVSTSTEASTATATTTSTAIPVEPLDHTFVLQSTYGELGMVVAGTRCYVKDEESPNPNKYINALEMAYNVTVMPDYVHRIQMAAQSMRVVRSDAELITADKNDCAFSVVVAVPASRRQDPTGKADVYNYFVYTSMDTFVMALLRSTETRRQGMRIDSPYFAIYTARGDLFHADGGRCCSDPRKNLRFSTADIREALIKSDYETLEKLDMIGVDDVSFPTSFSNFGWSPEARRMVLFARTLDTDVNGKCCSQENTERALKVASISPEQTTKRLTSFIGPMASIVTGSVDRFGGTANRRQWEGSAEGLEWLRTVDDHIGTLSPPVGTHTVERPFDQTTTTDIDTDQPAAVVTARASMEQRGQRDSEDIENRPRKQKNVIAVPCGVCMAQSIYVCGVCYETFCSLEHATPKVHQCQETPARTSWSRRLQNTGRN